MRALVLVVLCGCGGEISYRCSDSVFSEARYISPHDCARTRAAVELAARLLHDSGWWEHASTRAPLYVADELELPGAPPGLHRYGLTHWNLLGATSVDVGSDYRGLLHELLHVQAMVAGDYSEGHVGWEHDGRHALSNLYEWAEAGVLTEHGHPGPMPRLIAESLEAAGWEQTIQARAALLAR